MVDYAVGLRVSEAVHLNATGIDSKHIVIRVDHRNNHKDCYALFSPCLLHVLRTYWQDAHPRHWLLPRDIPGHPITPTAVARIGALARQRCGIQNPMTPHSLSHAFATRLLEAGTDVRRIQLLMGHRSLATASRYVNIATTTVCATESPFDLLPHPAPIPSPPPAPEYF
jgi:integrase/recombinase XerD